ncbi:MAG: hypothetical protein WC325_10550, partial [Candidatus Bathyarchaeia archaeon]
TTVFCFPFLPVSASENVYPQEESAFGLLGFSAFWLLPHLRNPLSALPETIDNATKTENPFEVHEAKTPKAKPADDCEDPHLNHHHDWSKTMEMN